MNRRAWAFTLLGAWVVSLGWLAQREFFKPTSARLAEAARAIPPSATFFRLDVGGAQVGFTSSTIDTLGDSLRVDEALVLEIATLGRMARTSARSVAIVGRTLRLRSLEVRFDGDLGAFTARGRVVNDTILRLELISAGDTSHTRVPLDPASVIPALLPFRLAFGGDLKPGATRSAIVFDPIQLARREVHVTVVRDSTLVVADSADFDSTAMAWVPVLFDTVPAVRIDLAGEGPATPTWVDAQGRVVRAGYPSGLHIERSAFEIAYENFRRRDTLRAARSSRAPARGAIVPTTALAAGVTPGGPEQGALRVLVHGAPPAAFAVATPRQQRAGDTLVVRRTGERAAGYRLPHAPAALAPWLTPDPLIQSDNPRIRAQARLLMGRERDPAAVATRLLDWVREEVAVRRTGGVPSAVRVFETRAGDCNEHAVLYVALARAAGVPARTAAGLLHADGRFYYHAWAEVYLGEWVAVDPMLGQFPADAAHLRLVAGGLARQIELVPLLGAAKLEVL